MKVKTSPDTCFSFRMQVVRRRRTLHHKVYFEFWEVFRVPLYVLLSQLLIFWQFINKYVYFLGPKLNTVEDFWRMVWQENILLIAMVTNLTEGSSVRVFLTSNCVSFPNKFNWTYFSWWFHVWLSFRIISNVLFP